MKLPARSLVFALSFLTFVPTRADARQVGATDYTKARTTTQALRGNLTLVQIHTPQDLNNILILNTPDGYLMVDHPEPAAAPLVKKQLEALGGKPVRFLLNTHWHYDHVGGNEIYGPEAVIVAQENVRTRLMAAQKPTWSPTTIGPYPEKAWPRVTFENSVSIHFGGEDIELDHYAAGHTDGDSVVYFKNANVVAVADIYTGRGDLASGVDMAGIAKSLTAVRDRINDDTVIVTGHAEALSSRADLSLYVTLLDATIEQVRADIAAGKSEADVIAHGMPDAWRQWFPSSHLPIAPDFLKSIYATATHTNHLGD